jgi:DNA polymerase-1
MDDIIFADCEGDNFVYDLKTIWTIQIATSVDGPVTVYADQPNYPPISEGLAILKAAKQVVFHNGNGYDFHAINKIYPGTLKITQMIDTLIISRLMDATSRRHSLADLGEVLGHHKGDFHDFSKFSPEMAKYGKQDVKILQEAWKGSDRVHSFGDFYKEFKVACDLEFYTHYVIEKQRQHGFNFDLQRALELEVVLRSEYVQITRDLQDIFPPIITKRVSEKTGKDLKDGIEVFNPGSRQQIAERFISKYDWKPLVFTTGKSVKIDEEVLNDLIFPEAKEVSRYLQLEKMLGQLSDGKNAWLKLYRENPNGTTSVHGFVNTIGCRTHRMSHGTPNMAQVNSDPRMREVWIPNPDQIMVGVDADGLELRMLAHYLCMYDNGAYVKFVDEGDKALGTDCHTQNMNAGGLYSRDNAKTMIYAHNYGCFDKKLGIIVILDARMAGKPIPKGTPEQLGKALRYKLERGIVGLGEIIAKCKRAHSSKSALPGLDGRWIPSASAHSALNTLLQGNGAIVMKVALNEFDREMEKLQLMDKFGYCANVHDEFQMSVNPDFAEKVKEVGVWSIKQAGEVLDMRCPLLGTAKSGINWSKTH